MILYHSSPVGGLTELLPAASTHGKAYVYATENKAYSLFFGAPKDDFDVLVTDEDGVPALYECYPGAIEKVYKGKKCSLYDVDPEGFFSGATGWDAELVSERSAKVLSESVIDDLFSEIMKEAKLGRAVIRFYSDEPEYREMLRSELTERVKAFGITKDRASCDERFKMYLNDIIGVDAFKD